ncbi:Hypothetical protein, putative [Bodo saltans]|uniref:PSI domain-containing protein n=1 Tax=Bodo saltans TaxID=75058 RepID=A0A0S4IQE0_BODSA|nr:Hypothetical protein, putative [Bodo saltans]|eukprot:CUE87266.1 Hypothetical protein, putative [Bodo saltans]
MNVLIKVSVVVLLLVAAAAAQNNCSEASACDYCAGLGGCGWCTYSGTCESGNQTGSFAGCVAPYWVWSAPSCPATPAPSTCSSASSCLSCTQLGGCGWCSSNNQCEQGNSTGSFQGCVSPYWSWTNNQCAATPAPASSCSQYSGFCDACTAQASCGYCLSTHVCEAGSGSGSSSGGCVAPNWAWFNSQCTVTPTPVPNNTPAPMSVCGDYENDCVGCTEQIGCGYCVSTNLCETGTGTGSNSGDCSGTNWVWYNSQCNSTQVH